MGFTAVPLFGHRGSGFGSSWLALVFHGAVHLQPTPIDAMAQYCLAQATTGPGVPHTCTYRVYYEAESHSKAPLTEHSGDEPHKQLLNPGISPFNQLPLLLFICVTWDKICS